MPYSHLSGAIVTSGQVEEHEQAMLKLPVAVRDGDDKIETTPEPETKVEEHDDESRIEIKIGEEGAEEVEGDDSGHEDSDNVEAEVDYSKADTKSIDDVAAIIAESEETRNGLLAEAIEKGMDKSLVAVFEKEIETNGKLSAGSYKALADVGYSKAFVDAFIAGQEAQAQKYIQAIHGFAGGQDNFNRLTGFIGANHPELAAAFNSALERNDVATMKALLSTGKELHRKSFGSRPARNVANLAKPAKTANAAPEVSGFESRAEMVKAMSDRRYQTDAKFRRKVELKVFASKF